MRRVLNVQDRNTECNAHCCTSHWKFVLLQEYRLCAVCVKCQIVSYVHYEGLQNSERKAPFACR